MTRTTSLPLSKRLWEKGLLVNTNDESIITFETTAGWCSGATTKRYDCIQEHINSGCKADHYPAYQTDELLEVLPNFIDDDKEYNLHIEKVINNDYIIRYENGSAETYSGITGEDDYYECNESLPEALGLMAEWLLGNGWVFDEKTKRLGKK